MNSQHFAITMHLMFAAPASVNPALKSWLNFFFPLAPQGQAATTAPAAQAQ